MGFARSPSPHVIQSAKTASVELLVPSDAAARVNQRRDPFGLVDHCPFSATGHDAVGACGDVVCAHCGKVFWQ